MNIAEEYIQYINKARRALFSPGIHPDPFFRENRDGVEEFDEEIDEEEINEIFSSGMPIDYIVSNEDGMK